MTRNAPTTENGAISPIAAHTAGTLLSVAAIKPVPRRKKIHAAAEIPISAQAAINADIAEFLPYPNRRVKKYRQHSTSKNNTYKTKQNAPPTECEQQHRAKNFATKQGRKIDINNLPTPTRAET